MSRLRSTRSPAPAARTRPNCMPGCGRRIHRCPTFSFHARTSTISSRTSKACERSLDPSRRLLISCPTWGWADRLNRLHRARLVVPQVPDPRADLEAFHLLRREWLEHRAQCAIADGPRAQALIPIQHLVAIRMRGAELCEVAGRELDSRYELTSSVRNRNKGNDPFFLR